MKRTYYLFNPGRLSRKDNTLKFTPVDEEGQEGQPRYIQLRKCTRCVNTSLCISRQQNKPRNQSIIIC